MRSLIDPVGGVPDAVAQRRFVWPLLLLCVFTAAAGAAIALKLDSARLVLPKLAASGELAKASEREVADAIAQASRVALVGGVAKGVFLAPLSVLLLAVALKIAAWLTGRKALFVELFTAAALAMLPVALFHCIEVLATLRVELLTPSMLERLVPTSLAAVWPDAGPKLGRVARAADVINVWVALVAGLGFAAASKWAPWKGAVFGVFLYVMFASVVFVALPGLVPPGGPP